MPEILLQRGRELYSLNGSVAVDRIIRFEHLAEDLEAVRQQLGLPEALQLPQAKAGVRKDKRKYQDFYTPAERDRVGEMFSREIETVGLRVLARRRPIARTHPGSQFPVQGSCSGGSGRSVVCGVRVASGSTSSMDAYLAVTIFQE